MKYYVNFILTFFLTILLTGCHENKTESDNVNSQQLYDETIAIIERYTDSISVCKDTMQLKRLNTDLEESLAAVSRHYPAFSDLSLSETQNDSIAAKLDRFVGLYQKAISRGVIVTDSISEDNQEPGTKI